MSKPTSIDIHDEDILSALKVRGIDYELIGKLRAEMSKHNKTYPRLNYLRISPQKTVFVTRVEMEEL